MQLEELNSKCDEKRLLLLYPEAILEITENSNTFNVQLKMELNV
jgi:hypothetical protein